MEQVRYEYNPWHEKKIRQLLFHVEEGQNLTNAIANCIFLLKEACAEADGYKKVLLGGSKDVNCAELDKIKLSDECICIIKALSYALIVCFKDIEAML